MGIVRLATGQPAAGVTVVLQTHGEYECAIYLNGTGLRDPLSEVWTKTDDQGRYRFLPKHDKFAVAALHPTGFGFATSEQIEKGEPITLAAWAKVELKGNAETGLSATRRGRERVPFR